MDINTNEVANNIPRREFARGTPKSRGKLFIFLVGIALGAFAIAAFVYAKNPQFFSFRTPEERAKILAESLVKDAGKIIILPTNEEPTIFDISNPDTLIAQQPFFTGSITGDKLLIYKQAARAIIYSPSRHLIVNVGPITNDQAPAVQQETAKDSPTSTRKK